MNFVYPRLDTPIALQLLKDYTGTPLRELETLSDTNHPRSSFYATGGSRVPKEKLEEIRVAVRTVALNHGYPAERGRAFTAFDQELAVVLHQLMDIVPADAADEGVWSFLSLVLLPDIAFWRWPNNDRRWDYERILGRPRNVFRRLWWRTFVLGEEISSRIGEDQAVGIMERPTVGGDPILARTLAEIVLRRAEQLRGIGASDLMRETTKRVLRLTSVVTLGALEQDELERQLLEVVGEATNALLERYRAEITPSSPLAAPLPATIAAGSTNLSSVLRSATRSFGSVIRGARTDEK